MLSELAKIAEAHEIIEHGPGDRRIFGRTVVKAPAAWNSPWSYHANPTSVVFAGAFIEVCDAHPQYVEERLNEVGGALLPDSFWCLWSSRLL